MDDDVVHHSMEFFATTSRYVYIYKTLDIFYISKITETLYHHWKDAVKRMLFYEIITGKF